MSKGKDISTMFIREENKKMKDLDIVKIPKKKMLSLVLHSAECFYRKEGENEEINFDR